MATLFDDPRRTGRSLTESIGADPLEVSKRRRRYPRPGRTQPSQPKWVSKKSKYGVHHDPIEPDGNTCSHWLAPGSDAGYCLFDADNARTGVEILYPWTKRSLSGGWRKKPTVFVEMTPSGLSKPPEWCQRPWQ